MGKQNFPHGAVRTPAKGADGEVGLLSLMKVGRGAPGQRKYVKAKH